MKVEVNVLGSLTSCGCQNAVATACVTAVTAFDLMRHQAVIQSLSCFISNASGTYGGVSSFKLKNKNKIGPEMQSDRLSHTLVLSVVL